MPEIKPPKQRILSKGVLTGNSLIGNRYTIIQLLGYGYWGSVYKAADKFERCYSVTIFPKKHIKRYFDIEDFKRQLIDSSKLLLNTQSNSLLIPYDVGEDADLFYIVNEFIEGVSLEGKIAKDGVLNPKQSLIIFSEILTALHALHSLKTIHGDLNTHNILISAPRFSSLYPDFFEVKIEWPIHISGFEFSQKKIQDDIHALGVVFLYMLTGVSLPRTPVKSSDILDVLKSKNPYLKNIEKSAIDNLSLLICNVLSDDPIRKSSIKILFKDTISLIKSLKKQSLEDIELTHKIETIPVSSENHDVFISYAKEDIDSARQLFIFLSDHGVKGWLDIEALLPGQNWENEISVAINNSRAFIALLSSHSVNKKGFVQKELRLALQELDKHPPGRIYIIPARLDDCSPSHTRLQEIHRVDLFPDSLRGFNRILKSLMAIGISVREERQMGSLINPLVEVERPLEN